MKSAAIIATLAVGGCYVLIKTVYNCTSATENLQHEISNIKEKQSSKVEGVEEMIRNKNYSLQLAFEQHKIQTKFETTLLTKRLDELQHAYSHLHRQEQELLKKKREQVQKELNDLLSEYDNKYKNSSLTKTLSAEDLSDVCAFLDLMKSKLEVLFKTMESSTD